MHYGMKKRETEKEKRAREQKSEREHRRQSAETVSTETAPALERRPHAPKPKSEPTGTNPHAPQPARVWRCGCAGGGGGQLGAAPQRADWTALCTLFTIL